VGERLQAGDRRKPRLQPVNPGETRQLKRTARKGRLKQMHYTSKNLLNQFDFLFVILLMILKKVLLSVFKIKRLLVLSIKTGNNK
jgi:hypothetical protein